MPNKISRIRYAAGAMLALGLTVPASAVTLDLVPALKAVRTLAAEEAAESKPVISMGFLQDKKPSRELPHPLDAPPMPFAEWANEGYAPIGDNWDATTSTLQKMLYGSKADSSRNKVYGWFDFGYTASTADHNTSPLSYGFMPNRPVLDQAVLRIERMPDTTQTDHADYGYRASLIYGTDYRFTAGDGWWFSQLQQHNQLYGGDAPELFGLYYLPHVAQGAVIMAGRYISPVDIEAQLAPQNYLYSHSLMFSVDPYTYTGANIETRWSKNWQTLTGFQYGNDKAPWEHSAQLNLEMLVGYHTDSNNDALWFGVDSIGGGKYKDGHDDLQLGSFTWGHKFNNKLHFQAQMYYMWERDAELGGTENDGPVEPYGLGGGAGPIIPGTSHNNGFVTYWEYTVNKKDYATLRYDFLNDPSGIRLGVSDFVQEVTLGYSHYFTKDVCFRPEVRYDWANWNSVYDNYTKKDMFTAAADIIIHF
jgi:hypothetical protein